MSPSLGFYGLSRSCVEHFQLDTIHFVRFHMGFAVYTMEHQDMRVKRTYTGTPFGFMV
jgi:hypothetical protein